MIFPLVIQGRPSSKGNEVLNTSMNGTLAVVSIISLVLIPIADLELGAALTKLLLIKLSNNSNGVSTLIVLKRFELFIIILQAFGFLNVFSLIQNNPH